MDSESSSNFYYRYVVRSEKDLFPAQHLRRIKKAQQNTTTHLLIDLTKIKTFKDVNLQMLNDGHHFEIIYLCKPMQALELQKLYHVELCQILLEFETADDLKHYQNLNLKLKSLNSPNTETDFKSFVHFVKGLSDEEVKNHYWSFKPYNQKIKKSVTLKNIYQTQMNFKTLNGLEINNTSIPENFELEPIVDLTWFFATPQKKIQLSLIIPSFNNIKFLTNVIEHLIHQSISAENYEIIIVEDGGTDQTASLLKELLIDFKNEINLKFIYWPKQHQQKGPQNFFRAGLARNLGVQFSESDKLFFLDSDMLVPNNFVELTLKELQKSEIIQYQRFHIHQKLSSSNPTYRSIQLANDVYTEEANYWTQLFTTKEWMQLPDYWKYTCTYALGLHKKNFLRVGRFKKYYVSYGFEDTDLGYELHKLGLSFKLIACPLLHLTSYDQMQYKNSRLQRLKLLRKTAALFYLQHLNPKIYELFGNFYRFEKPLRTTLRDLF